MIKSYRGLIASGAQHTIPLHTNDGKTGYKVIKFEIMPVDANTTTENVVKIYKISQTTVTTDIDFNDNTLLAASAINDSTDPGQPPSAIVIFDNEVFNQDIYVTNKGHDATPAVNYYFELEQVNLTEDQALVAIVKNLRNEQ